MPAGSHPSRDVEQGPVGELRHRIVERCGRLRRTERRLDRRRSTFVDATSHSEVEREPQARARTGRWPEKWDCYVPRASDPRCSVTGSMRSCDAFYT